MRNTLFAALAALALVSPTLVEGQNLTQGINAVAAVQHKREEKQAEARAAQRAAEQAAQARRELRAQEQLNELERRDAQDQTIALAAAKVRQARAAASVHYQNQVRQLQLQQMRLRLQAQQDKVARENDFINAQLKRENAETDVVQSEADANRNISSGAKVLMEKTGEAEVRQASVRKKRP